MGHIVIGIHGLSNKPAAPQLETWWKKAMLEGLAVNANITEANLNFRSVYWADVMYKKPLTTTASTKTFFLEKEDRYTKAKVGSLIRYEDGWLDSARAMASDTTGEAIDMFKKMFGIDRIADSVLKRRLKDLSRYHSEIELREKLRSLLATELNKHRDKRIMLVAHSMGSIIAYDTLREMGKKENPIMVNHFVTIGSPLGLPHVKMKIREESPDIRTPSIVKRWTNLADRRDPVAIDTHLSGDYKANDAGIKVKDDLILNDWGGINHKSYGYLRCPEFTDLLKSFI